MTYDERSLELKRSIVTPIQEEWPCPFTPSCEGFMEFTGEAFTTIFTSYTHVCTRCGMRANLRGQTFPRIVHERVGEARGIAK